MKPEWKDAPEWANYLAMDSDGEWFWYEHEPIVRGGCWAVTKGLSRYAGKWYWTETKGVRPVSSTKENTTC